MEDSRRSCLESGNMAACAPDLVSYNTHLHALSMHAGKRPGLAARAEALLQTMEHLYDSGQSKFSPNPFTYNLVLEGFARSPDVGSPGRAAKVLRRLIRRDGIEPSTFAFNQVLAAFARSMNPSSSMFGSDGVVDHMATMQRMLDLLAYMHDAYESGIHPHARPDVSSYTSCIIALSRSGQTGAAEKAEALYNDLVRRYEATGRSDKSLKPTRVLMNALIDCWAKSGEGTLGARKAEAIVAEMHAQCEAGDISMAPNAVSYNALLNAWGRSGTRCCGTKAEQYLELMWNLYRDGNEKVKPNDLTYNTVINAISKSKSKDKAQKSLRLLRRMDKEYRAGDKDIRPTEITYTAVLNSCAFAEPDSMTRRKALDTAIFTLKEVQSSQEIRPNQVTYGMFLKAVANLLNDEENDAMANERRRDIVQAAFEQCCLDGQVGEMVLTYFRRAAPEDLYRELLRDRVTTGDTTKPISVEDLPLEWRANVRHRSGRWGSQQRRQVAFTRSCSRKGESEFDRRIALRKKARRG
jgi:hypothetical protein